MKSLLTSVAVMAALTAAPAFGADIPVKAPPPAAAPVYSWTGFYFGGNAGMVWARVRAGWVVDPNNDTDAAGAIAQREALSTRTLKGLAPTAGLQAGYNWELGRTLVGVEVDFNSTVASDRVFSTLVAPFAANNLTQSFRLDWFATARLRLGLVSGRSLFYVTGGAAAGRVNLFDTTCYPACGFSQTADVTKTKFGWTAGGGIEFALSERWTIKGEYLHVDLGRQQTYSIQPAGPIGYFHNHRMSVDIGRIGLNYRFGNPVVARN